ncbi:DnaJ domain-containing protein, partial [Tricladium varicosporioides]
MSGEESGEEESSTEHTKATRYTREQREVVTRVRKCPEKDYYAILGLEENCSGIEVKKAYRELSLLTHPDKNKYKDAEKAFKMVSRAYQVLGDSLERTRYNRNRKAYKLRGELDPIDLWDEEFAENASGTDSGSESDGDDSEEEEEMKPDSFRLGIYKEATPLVRKLLADPRDSSTKSEIESLNKRIKKQNKKDGFKEGEFCISVNVLRSIGMEAGVAAKYLEKDPDDKQAKELQGRLEKQFEKTIRINSYPREW